MAEGFDGETLRHPLYLDVPMMTSFLATITDGVSFEAKVQTKRGTKQQVTAGVEAGTTIKPPIPSLLSLLSLDLRGKLGAERGTEENEEMEIVRRHTEASLFNQLRNLLADNQAIVRLDSNEEDWDNLRIGEIVEITGEIQRNPLATILDLYGRVIEPVWQKGIEQQQKRLLAIETELKTIATQRPQAGQRSKPPSQNTETRQQGLEEERTELEAKAASNDETMLVVGLIRDDLRASHLQDVILNPQDTSGKPCILTLSSEAGFGRPLEDLLGAELVVLGKITKIVKEGETINLLRRSALAFMSNNIMNDLAQELDNAPGLNFKLTKTELEGPSLQILPMAIFA